MVINKPGSPKETSTPNFKLVRGRKTIHDNDILSPISGDDKFLPYISEHSNIHNQIEKVPESAHEHYRNPLNNSSPSLSKSNRRSDTENDRDVDESDDNHQKEVSNTAQGRSPTLIIVSIAVLFVLVAFGFHYTGNQQSEDYQKASQVELQTKFDIYENQMKNQNQDFWRSIKVSIKEIPVLKQPKTIIFLYEEKSEKTLNRIMEKIIEAALCFLTGCDKNAIHITGASLNTSEMINDHGVIISKYKVHLEKSGVMAVHNLEQVPGKVALAFHSFCDDYNPIVKKSLILFTLKVDKLPEGYPMHFLEKFLLNLWSDIGRGDKFHPLFTRISGNILTVQPE